MFADSNALESVRMGRTVKGISGVPILVIILFTQNLVIAISETLSGDATSISQ